MNATSTGPLPSELLDRDDVRRALAEHDFAAAFILMKKYSGLSQNKIAAACQLTPGKVSKIVSGQHQVTSFDVISRISDGLRVPGHMLGLARRTWEQSGEDTDQGHGEGTADPIDSDRSADVPWRRTTAVVLAAQVTRSDLVMDRRAASRAIVAGVATGAGLLAPLDGWLEPAAAEEERPRLGRLSTGDVDELENTAQAFRAWDHKYGGGLRRRAVVGQLREVSSALEEHQATAVEERLYRVMAQLAGTAATMAWDSGMQRRAQEYYRIALRAAHGGGDRTFGANVLAGMARQMLYTGRPQDALELVRLAQDGTRGETGPRVRAMLHTREAWALSAMGRMSAFNRATMQAADVLANAGSSEEPYWIAYFDEAELAGVTGGRLLDRARDDPRTHAETAAEHIRTALKKRKGEAGRSRALDRIGLAECAFLAGDVTYAVTETHRAVEAAEVTQSSRVRAQLRQLYPYTVGHSASRRVREARDRIRGLLAG